MTINIRDRTIYNDQTQSYYIFTSDIHGNANTLTLIKQAQKDYPTAQLVGGGDYIDGCKNSKEVCDYLIEQSQQGAIILNGNHEELMLNFANGFDDFELGIEPLWYANGGKTTMRSFLGRGYSKPKTAKMLQHTKYYNFFINRPIMYVTPHIIFVHGGIKPVPNFDDLKQYQNHTLETNLNSYDFYRLWARKEYWYHEILAKNQHELPHDTQFIIKNNRIYLKVFAHNQTKHTIVTGHTPTTFINGSFDDGRMLNTVPQTKCIVRIVNYPNEPSRIFTDGGCHSKLAHNWGNVTVLDKLGNIVKIYDYRHPLGLDLKNYCQVYHKDNIYGK